MKALFTVTGRGIGGDAVTALNIAGALSKRGVECEFALDHSASGLLFKKRGLKWYKIGIPQAGGHAATKKTMIKAIFKALRAVFEAANLCRKTHPDVVVGVIGGGAVIGCLAAKLVHIPSVGILITPMDAKVCTKISRTVALPESNLFQTKIQDKGIEKVYSPINPDVVIGDKEKALKRMPENYDENLPTILLSSGSTLFEKMALAAEKLGKGRIKANIIVVGDPLEERYLEYFDQEKVIYLGYVDWIRDLYKLVDLAVVTDDGMMIHESIASNIPVVALLGVKYGRYHDLASVFEGAVLESELEDIENVIEEAFKNIDEMKSNASKYAPDILKAADKIAEIICDEIKR